MEDSFGGASLVAALLGATLFGLHQYTARGRSWGLQIILFLVIPLGGMVLLGRMAGMAMPDLCLSFGGLSMGIGLAWTACLCLPARSRSHWGRCLVRGLVVAVCCTPVVLGRGESTAHPDNLLRTVLFAVFGNDVPPLHGMLVIPLFEAVLGALPFWRASCDLAVPGSWRVLLVALAVMAVLRTEAWCESRWCFTAVDEEPEQDVTLLNRLTGRGRLVALFVALLIVVGVTHLGVRHLSTARNQAGETPMHLWAVWREDWRSSDNPPLAVLKCAPEFVPLLVAHGADPNARAVGGQCPLHKAARYADAEAVAALLAAGAKVDATDYLGRTALHCAVCSEYGPEGSGAAKTAVLLHGGADVNARDKTGWTPLHYAGLTKGCPGMNRTIQELLAAGADVNARNDDGWTLLHASALAGDTDRVAGLLAAGAQVNEVIVAGKTAMDMAQHSLAKAAAGWAFGKAGWNWYDTDSIRALYQATIDLLRQAGGKTGAELDAEKATPAQGPVKPPEPGR